jgi:hypothetical protein
MSTVTPLITIDALIERGIPHAFTTRRGGVSSAPFDSFNFGNPGELPPDVPKDPRTNIIRNFRLLLDTIDARAQVRRIAQVHQVHGADVLVLPRLNRPFVLHATGECTYFPHIDHEALDDATSTHSSIDWGSVKADAIVTDDPGVLAVVRVADCAPILLATNDGRAVAAVHAGWRGTVAGVVSNAARTLRELDDTSRPLLGAIGPCIGPEHFEVGQEVVRAFRGSLGVRAPVVPHADLVQHRSGKAMIDLRRALEAQMAEERIALCASPAICTVSRPDLCFSHRRDRGITGRMVGAIAPLDKRI